MNGELDARGPGRSVSSRPSFANGKSVQHSLKNSRPGRRGGAYSITRGTTYRPACTAGALAWYFSWASISVTASARRR